MAKKQDNRRPLVSTDTPRAANACQKVAITEGQREVFLDTLRATGVVAWAARTAGRSRSGFDTLKRRDPEFAKLWDDAIEEATGTVEREAFRRAVEGTERYEVSGGQVVLHPETGEPIKRREWSDSILAMMLKAKIQSYSTRQTIDVNHHHSRDGATISASDIMMLSDEEQTVFLDLLGRIDEERNKRKNGQGQDQIEAEDAEFDEVSDAEVVGDDGDLDKETAAELQSIL